MKRVLAGLLALLLAAPAWAGRDFDGTNDEIAFGSDASIDAFTSRSITLWVRADEAATDMLVTKGVGTSDLFSNSTEQVRYVSDWTTDGNWIGTADIVTGEYVFLCVSYNNAATTNDPTFRVDGATDALTTDTAPTGSVVSDADNELQLGETNADAADFNGNIAFFNFLSGAMNAAACNRTRWWGRAPGAEVYHPFMTDKLANEGTATADGTATGTTVVGSMVPVVRPGSALLNSGIGW